MEKSKKPTLNEFWPFKKFLKTNVTITNEERDQIKYMLYNFDSLSTDPTNTTTYGHYLNILNLPYLI